jgi:hypothetical protein
MTYKQILAAYSIVGISMAAISITMGEIRDRRQFRKLRKNNAKHELTNEDWKEFVVRIETVIEDLDSQIETAKFWEIVTRDI